MTLRREIPLLLDGTAISPDASQVSRMREHIQAGIDWSELLRLAIPHGVLPLLSRNLATHAASLVPQDTLVQLEHFGKRVAERSRKQSLELVKLVSALSEDGFRVLPFKGAVLAQEFYGDVGLRESHDIDLWIDPLQFGRAMEWFREAGYRPTHHVLGVPQELPFHRAKQEEFKSPDGNTIVEIKAHIEWSEVSVFDPPFDDAWNRRGNANFDGFEVPVIAVEDLLPSLAVHGSKHMWRRLNWIVDIAAVMSSHPGPDWQKVLSHAIEWRCRRRLLTAVGLAATLYEIEIPKPISSDIQDPSIRSAVAHIRAGLFSPKAHTFRGLSSDFIYSLQSSDSARERLRYILSTRHFLSRTMRADESRMMIPMSGNVRRIYSAFATVRNWIERA